MSVLIRSNCMLYQFGGRMCKQYKFSYCWYGQFSNVNNLVEKEVELSACQMNSFLNQNILLFLKHKAGIANKAAYALSRIQVIAFGYSLKLPPFFRWMVSMLSEFPNHDIYLFKGTRLYVPNISHRKQVIWELAAVHFGQDKTVTMVDDHLY